MSAVDPPQEQTSSCWLRGCLLTAVVLSAVLVLIVIFMMLSRMTPPAS